MGKPVRSTLQGGEQDSRALIVAFPDFNQKGKQIKGNGAKALQTITVLQSVPFVTNQQLKAEERSTKTMRMHQVPYRLFWTMEAYFRNIS